MDLQYKQQGSSIGEPSFWPIEHQLAFITKAEIADTQDSNVTAIYRIFVVTESGTSQLIGQLSFWWDFILACVTNLRLLSLVRYENSGME